MSSRLRHDRRQADRARSFARSVPLAFGALVAFVVSVLPVVAQSSDPVATAAGDGSPDRSQLIERHLKWLGGRDRLGSLRSVSFSGRLEAAGLEGAIEIQMAGPDRLHMDYELGPLRGTECVSSEDAWRINEVGQVEGLGEESRTAHEWSLDSAFSLSLLGLRDQLVESVGKEERDGKVWDVLRVGEAAGNHRDLFLDPEYGGLVWTRAVDDGDTSWIETTDWRADHGIRLPFRVRQLYGQSARNTTVEWKRVLVDHETPASLFERPARSRRIGRIDDDRLSTGWIPIERYRGRWVFLRGTVDGVDVDLVLDSGAGMTVLDREFADRIGVEASGTVAAQGVGGTSEASIVDSLEVVLGNLRFDGMTAAVIDLSGVAKAMGREIPVILGKEVFHEFVVDLDYPNDRIAFHDRERFEYRGSGHDLQLQPGEGGLKLVRVGIEGLPETEFNLDTGSGGTLTVFPHYAEAQGLLEGRRLSDARSGGVGGGTVDATGTLQKVTIAGFDLKDVPVHFFSGGEGAFDTQRHQGNLGAGILSRFRVLFDYGNERLYLEPGSGFDEPFRRDRIGLSVEGEAGGARVTHVAKGSPAAEAGLETGTILVSLDGEPLGESAPDVLWEAAGGDVGGVVTVVDDQGHRFELRRRDYY